MARLWVYPVWRCSEIDRWLIGFRVTAISAKPPVLRYTLITLEECGKWSVMRCGWEVSKVKRHLWQDFWTSSADPSTLMKRRCFQPLLGLCLPIYYAYKPSLRLCLLCHSEIFVRLKYHSRHFLFGHVSVMNNVLSVVLHSSVSISVQIL